jgi:cysteine synthase
MKTIMLSLVAASLMAASTVSMAAASERHHVKAHRAVVSDQFRNANNAIAWPIQTEPNWVSDYSEGHVISAPAGR